MNNENNENNQDNAKELRLFKEARFTFKIQHDTARIKLGCINLPEVTEALDVKNWTALSANIELPAFAIGSYIFSPNDLLKAFEDTIEGLKAQAIETLKEVETKRLQLATITDNEKAVELMVEMTRLENQAKEYRFENGISIDSILLIHKHLLINTISPLVGQIPAEDINKASRIIESISINVEIFRTSRNKAGEEKVSTYDTSYDGKKKAVGLSEIIEELKTELEQTKHELTEAKATQERLRRELEEAKRRADEAERKLALQSEMNSLVLPSLPAVAYGSMPPSLPSGANGSALPPPPPPPPPFPSGGLKMGLSGGLVKIKKDPSEQGSSPEKRGVKRETPAPLMTQEGLNAKLAEMRENARKRAEAAGGQSPESLNAGGATKSPGSDNLATEAVAMHGNLRKTPSSSPSASNSANSEISVARSSAPTVSDNPAATFSTFGVKLKKTGATSPASTSASGSRNGSPENDGVKAGLSPRK